MGLNLKCPLTGEFILNQVTIMSLKTNPDSVSIRYHFLMFIVYIQ